MHIYSQSKILMFAFMAACTQASSMQRTSSVAHFDNYATDNDHWPALPDALISKFVKRGEPISSHIFFELGQIFGFKRYPAANRGSDEEVISVDISWPNLRRVVLKKLRDVSATPIPSDLTPQSILTRSHLKWLLEAWGTSFDRMEGIFGNADPDEITSGLTQEQINLLWNICNERIFDLSFIHDEQSSDGKQCRQDAFETAVKSLLLTKSGAQRILSLIFAKFATENENVSPIYTPTQIRIQDGSEQWDGVSCDLSVIFDTHPSDMALALFHELSHAYSSFVISAWTYYGDSPDSKYLAAFTNYSIMNSPSVNFVREFYPMLSPAIMKPATEAIEKWMRAHLEQIFFKKRVDFTQDGDFTKITQYLPFFTNLLNGVKDFGFGNIIANDDDPLSLAAKLIYIQSIAAIFYFDANNLYESYLDGYCCTDDNRSLENTLWGMFSYDEMLTMRGVMVAKIGQRTFLLENRQNENIHTERLYQFFKTSSDQFESKLKENIDSRHYHLLSKTTMPEDVIYELRRLTHAEMCDFDELKNQLSSISIDPVVNKYVESSEDMSYIRTEYDPNFQTQILFFLANEYGTNSNVLHLNLKNLVVPSDVQSLKSQICRNLHNLKTVSFEKNSKTTHIGSCAFEGCSSLVSVEIPKSVTYIGINAFSDCQSLETVEFENSSQLTKIESDAFRGCTSLTSITIPASVRFIEAGAFDSCTNLREVRFASGSNLEYLSIDVFRNCQSLRTIEIPSKVKTICERAFSYVPIEEIYIPDSVEDIEPCAFTECRSLRQVHFVGNSNLKHLTLAAFWACSNLNELIIPASVERIDENPFVLPLLHNFGAKTIRFSHGSQLQTIGALAFATRNLQSISLPEGLQVIEDHAFEGCSLKEIFIPKTVNLIEDFSFLNCLKLEKIHFEEGISPSLLIGNNAIGKAMSSFQRYEIVPSLSRVIIPSSLKNNNYVKTFEYDLAQKDTDPISIEWVGDVLSDQQPD